MFHILPVVAELQSVLNMRHLLRQMYQSRHSSSGLAGKAGRLSEFLPVQLEERKEGKKSAADAAAAADGDALAERGKAMEEDPKAGDK